MQSVIQHWRKEENQTNLSSLITRREARFEQRKIKMQKSDKKNKKIHSLVRVRMMKTVMAWVTVVKKLAKYNKLREIR